MHRVRSREDRGTLFSAFNRSDSLYTAVLAFTFFWVMATPKAPAYHRLRISTTMRSCHWELIWTSIARKPNSIPLKEIKFIGRLVLDHR